MGSGASTLFPCIKPPAANFKDSEEPGEGAASLIFDSSLDETLGHSFCYIRSSNRFLSPSQSDRFAGVSPSTSLRFSPSQDISEPIASASTGFKAISGASVSANTSTMQTVVQLDSGSEYGKMAKRSAVVNLRDFESTSLFSALPLQPVPRGGEGFFQSGPLERGALSGPIDPRTQGSSNAGNGPSRVPFSAPLCLPDEKKKGRKGIAGIKRALYKNIPEKRNLPWVAPVMKFVKRKEKREKEEEKEEVDEAESQIQWALGKAGEDRVHVVVSEELGWLFIGIYDGFNGPDAPEFLMKNLYRCVQSELGGLFWEIEDEISSNAYELQDEHIPEKLDRMSSESNGASKTVKRVTIQPTEREIVPRKRLWELMAEDDSAYALDLSCSGRFTFSIDDASSSASGRWHLLSNLKHGLKIPQSSKVEEETNRKSVKRRKKVGPADHDLVLRAISKALQLAESAYLGMTDKMLETNPELALMGSCLLVMLMREDDVYVMNVGDSRAIVAQSCDRSKEGTSRKLTALQLSTDHSTNIEEEIARIKREHPDDEQCIVNDRVKGRLKVTRAFGAGFLKQPKFNDAVLEMFRNEYVGTAPYLSCTPSLRHHRLSQMDQFLVLSSDGLYQFLTNEEVVSDVESFMENFPDGDPAQHLIEEVLSRAAKKAGLDFHELLEIPQGDRRKYHDDVTVMVISLEGRIWKSSG